MLVNVGIVNEGYDEPAIEVVVQARPTASRLLYAQQAGRAMRPLPGVIDGLESADERRTAIAHSSKPTAKILDFVGNSGRHKLMTTADILGGKMTDEVIARTNERMQEKGRGARTDEEIAAAIADVEERKRKESARKARLVAKSTYRAVRVDPFTAFDVTPVRERGWDRGKMLSEKQRALLLKQGLDPDAIPYAHAKQIIGEFFRRWKGKLCTLKQAKFLKGRGIETHDLTMAAASAMITEIANREGWRNKS